jgi:sulfonate transport system permease protein
MRIWQRRGQGIPLLLGVVLLWEVLPRLGILDPVLIPPFDRVIRRAVTLLWSGDLLVHTAVSLLRVLLGFVVAAAVAVPLGVLLGLWPAVRRRTDLLVGILRPISPPAWIPLAILWFGIGDRPAIFIIFMGTALSLLIGVLGAAQGVDKRLIKAGLTLGASRRQAIRLIVLPMLLPALFTQLRVALGLAWMCVMAAEMVAVRQGLGYMMIQARNLFQTDTVLVGMVTAGGVGWLLDALLHAVERRALHWRAGLEAHGLFAHQ